MEISRPLISPLSGAYMSFQMMEATTRETTAGMKKSERNP